MASVPEIDGVVAENATRTVSLHRGLQTVIAEREADIVDEMVLTFRNGRANLEYLVARIAAISELRQLEASLDRSARQAIDKASPERKA